jgi:4-diphosphocytidyl-2-C-methyl-D-erythritol kinase
LRGRPTMARGIGEILDAAPRLPPDLPVVIAHTRKALPTPSVFRALHAEERSGAAPPMPDRFVDAEALCAFLRATRNDLEAPAIRLEPTIGKLLDDMRTKPGCLITRMSGSGAACFGLFASDEAASGASKELADAGWWAVASRLLS